MYIDNFKPFNDYYGFQRGDVVIKAIGEIISGVTRSMGTGFSCYCGHIGGDDFIVITSPEDHENLAKSIIDQFNTHVTTCFKKEDAARGFYKGTDRRGEKKEFPLTTISIGIISNVKTSFHDATQMGQFLVKAKNMAKQAEEKQGGRSTYVYLERAQDQTDGS